MKTNKKSKLKVILGVVSVVLFVFVALVANALVGNPISKMMAEKAIDQYVKKNYSHLDLEVEKPYYNFKDGSYAAMAESKTSIDTKFAIYYREGKVQRDDYETYVLGMFNTIQRLSDEYSVIAKDIIAKELGYKNNTTMVLYNQDEYENADDILKLDMKFDKSLPLDSEVIIRLDLEDTSLEKASKILTDAHEAFKRNNCNFNRYGYFTEKDKIFVMINGVTPDDIESGKLLSILENAKNNESQGRISVFIKDDEKHTN